MTDETHRFFVNSLVSGRDLSPQVVIELDDLRTQVSAEKAREIAMMIWEASEAAMSDAMLVQFITKTTGAPVDSAIAAILGEFRIFRDEEKRKQEEEDSQ